MGIPPFGNELLYAYYSAAIGGKKVGREEREKIFALLAVHKSAFGESARKRERIFYSFLLGKPLDKSA